jgi:hypothetical protein
MWWQWCIHFMGVDQGLKYGTWNFYNFWSGFASDIGQVAIVGGLLQVYKRHNCHITKCWRIGKFKVIGTPYLVCIIHRPEMEARHKPKFRPAARNGFRVTPHDVKREYEKINGNAHKHPGHQDAPRRHPGGQDD